MTSSTRRIRKGMILGAGLGTRLLPVTEKVPKPLVPVLNLPNILHTLFFLKRAGVEEIIINLHHLPDAIEHFLENGRRWGVHLEYSREPKLLGTGGGVKKAERFFNGETFVLANCDFITNADIRPAIAEHFSRRALGTMLLYHNPEIQPRYSKVGVSENGNLCSLPSCQTQSPARTGIFTGIHLLEAETLGLLDEVPCGINEILYPRLMREQPDRVYARYLVNGEYWLDTGEAPTLWNASQHLLASLQHGDPVLTRFLSEVAGYEAGRNGLWAPAGYTLPPQVEIAGPVILGPNCRLEKGAVLGPYTVLGENSRIGEGARVTRFVGLESTDIDARESKAGVLQYGRRELFHFPSAHH